MLRKGTAVAVAQGLAVGSLLLLPRNGAIMMTTMAKIEPDCAVEGFEEPKCVFGLETRINVCLFLPSAL